jgi:hypothetical protein
MRAISAGCLLLVFAAFTAYGAGVEQIKPPHEDCGWLIVSGDGLVPLSDPTLKPLDPKRIATPFEQARAAYCIRDTIMTGIGDERLVRMGFPLVIRSGEREGVLEDPPQVRFDYHREGDRYLPGEASDRH